MALTVYKQPQTLTPAYNEQIFTALSTQIAIADFKYIVTVTVNGDTANTYTENILQRPDGWLVFDAKEWVKNYIQHYFNPNDTNVVIATNKSVSVDVEISEYYTGIIQSTTPINYNAFDACLTDEDFRNYDFNDYLFGENVDKYLLSKGSVNEVDTTFTIDQNIWLHFFNGTTNPITGVVVELRNGASVVGGFSSSIPTPITGYDMLALNVGKLLGAVAGYTIRVNFNGASGLIKRFTLSLVDNQTDFTDYSVYYLDRNGAIQMKHFDKLSTKSHTKKTNTVTLDKNVLNTTTGAYGSNSYDREIHVVSTSSESSITLNTNWITQEQSTLLKDLWDSPIGYLWDGVTLKSFNPANSPYDEKVEALDNLFSYTMTIDLGITETRQRGI
jgi:hypothetical protein